MTTGDPAGLVVLHGLRVRGFAEVPALAEFTGLVEPEVAERLDALSTGGLVAHRDGMVGGWHLTPAGRIEHATALAAAAPDEVALAQVRAGYERFADLDPVVKGVCTAWQVRDLDAGVINDHSDAAYDADVVDRLGAVHVEALAVVDALAEALDRFGPYRRRLDTAYRRVRAGDGDAFTKPLSGSYHDVWMDLHEDLLVTLGLERSAP
jgi:hypothetical protein